MEKNCDGAVHIMTYRVSKKTHGMASAEASRIGARPSAFIVRKNGYVIHGKAFVNLFCPRQNYLR